MDKANRDTRKELHRTTPGGRRAEAFKMSKKELGVKYPGESNQQLRRKILENIVDAVKALQTSLIAIHDGR